MNNEKSSKEGVKKLRNAMLKFRFDKAIEDAGMTNSEFYRKVGITRQYYSKLAYGFWKCPLRLKIKIGKVLGCDSASIFEIKEKDISELKKSIKEGCVE